MNRAQLKSLAKSQIQGNIGMLFLITLVMAAVTSLANIVPVIGPVVVSSAFALAMVKIYLRLAKGTNPELGDLFSEFSNFWAAFKVTFLVGLYTALWSLLFYIPGIIKGLSYSQAMYIMAENPGITATEAINRSKAMMEGHKMELFMLMLSFIGWFFLVGITFGIASIYVVPYLQATMTNFYNSIKPNAEAPAAPTVEF